MLSLEQNIRLREVTLEIRTLPFLQAKNTAFAKENLRAKQEIYLYLDPTYSLLFVRPINTAFAIGKLSRNLEFIK